MPALGGVVRLGHCQDAHVVGAMPGLGGRIVLGDVLIDTQIVGALPGLAGHVEIRKVIGAQIVAVLPALGGRVKLNFDVSVDRPTVGLIATSSQIAAATPIGVQDKAQEPIKTQNGPTTGSNETIRFEAGVQSLNGEMLPIRGQGMTRSDDAIRVGNWTVKTTHAEMLRDRRPALRTSSQEGVDVRQSLHTSSQDMYRWRSQAHTSSQEAIKRIQQHRGRHTTANRMLAQRRTRSQEAMVPPPGVIRVTPPSSPCYTPSTDLLFEFAGPADTQLIFYCENHDTPPDHETVVVPIRSVYIVINNVTLKRVAGNVPVPTTALSLSIDAESWTWGFTARIPQSAFDTVKSSDGTPVELEANINGTAYRLLAENIARSRTFESSELTISGRGKSAVLASPYSQILTFNNDIERTAQQLMGDVLTFNGVPIGWDVDWQLTDWLVPAGVFNVKGSYIDGLNAIVSAVGAYLQPDPVAQTMRALLRYPVAPWDWSGVTPDFELPSAVVQQEGIEWKVKADYNRVYVSGVSQGVLGRVTRSGTAGDLMAPMVTDALITEAAAARQRGISILGDTGRQALVTLRMPVLDTTGIIEPGKFVQYVDGSDTKIGIVRSTSVDAALPEVWQQLQVETHEL